MIRLVVVLGAAVFGLSATAATPYKRALGVKSNLYMKDGVYIGGKAGGGTSLLGVRRAYSAKANLERVIIDLGDQDARPAGKNLGYYQVAMDAANNRVVLDLAQLRFSKVSEGQIQALFRNSPNVVSAQLTLDPEDKAGTMVLQLKHPMRLESFQLVKAGKPGRVILDLKPLSAPSTSLLPQAEGSRLASPKHRTAKRKSIKRDEAFE